MKHCPTFTRPATPARIPATKSARSATAAKATSAAEMTHAHAAPASAGIALATEREIAAKTATKSATKTASGGILITASGQRTNITLETLETRATPATAALLPARLSAPAMPHIEMPATIPAKNRQQAQLYHPPQPFRQHTDPAAPPTKTTMPSRSPLALHESKTTFRRGKNEKNLNFHHISGHGRWRSGCRSPGSRCSQTRRSWSVAVIHCLGGTNTHSTVA